MEPTCTGDAQLLSVSTEPTYANHPSTPACQEHDACCSGVASQPGQPADEQGEGADAAAAASQQAQAAQMQPMTAEVAPGGTSEEAPNVSPRRRTRSKRKSTGTS